MSDFNLVRSIILQFPQKGVFSSNIMSSTNMELIVLSR